jgi:hypothetical protein
MSWAHTNLKLTRTFWITYVHVRKPFGINFSYRVFHEYTIVFLSNFYHLGVYMQDTDGKIMKVSSECGETEDYRVVQIPQNVQ